MYLVLMGEWNPSESFLHTGGGGILFNPSERKHKLKRAESHPFEVNTFGIFACNFRMFFMVSQRHSF